MSTDDPTVPAEGTVLTTTPGPDSLKGRLAARRRELREERPIDVPVPGFEKILVARYHALDYRDVRSIGLRQQNNKDQADAEVKVAADALVQACEDLLEIMPDGVLRSTGGYTWTAEAARELFAVDEADLPDGSTSRQALLQIMTPMQVVLHYAEYDERSRAVNEEVQEELQGESEASSAVV